VPAVAKVDGGFMVQLASLKSRNGVNPEWARLVKRFPSLLGNHKLVVQRAQIAGSGTFYRVQAGPFAKRAGADALCRQLKAQQQACLVVKRGG
jgi:cell division septation protein DedD